MTLEWIKELGTRNIRGGQVFDVKILSSGVSWPSRKTPSSFISANRSSKKVKQRKDPRSFFDYRLIDRRYYDYLYR